MRRILCACIVTCCAGAAFAQMAPLADPTRPPSAGAQASASEPAVRSGPQLQSVLISPTRRVAVISGQAVQLGGRYGDATVASITEGAVLLKYANRSTTLRLISGVEKRERPVAEAMASEKGPSR